MYDYRARFYDPLTGSFIQPDSIVPDALDPRAWNRLGYVYGNPVNYTDPSGHCIDGISTGVCLAIGAGVLLGAGAGGYYGYQQGYGFDTWQFYGYAGLGGLASGVGGAAGLWVGAALVPAGAAWWQVAGAGVIGGAAGGVVEQGILEVGGAYVFGTEVSTERILFAGAVGGVTGGVFAGGARLGLPPKSIRGGIGFETFDDLKKYLGPAGWLRDWHHIVEQNNSIARGGRFPNRWIHNTKNVVNIRSRFPGSLHGRVTGHYNSKMANGVRVRDWVNTLSFDRAYEYGVNVLRDKGYKGPLP